VGLCVAPLNPPRPPGTPPERGFVGYLAISNQKILYSLLHQEHSMKPTLSQAEWLFPHTPIAPDYALDWSAITQSYPWLHPLADCPQNPIYHAEGDVLTHTRLVCEAMVAGAEWRSLPPIAQSILFAAALMHDIAKPKATTIEPDGTITAKGHVRQSVKMANRILWDMGVEVNHRAAIANLIQNGSLPMWFWDKPNPRRSLITASQLIRCDWLALLMEADIRGRWCDDRPQLLERVVFFREYAAELGCLDRPWSFASDHSRFLYFQKEDADPNHEAFDDTRSQVILMSGLPGVGKDTWIAQNHPDWPVVSLDALRQQLGIDPGEEQGMVVQQAKEQAKTYLRKNQSFIWNATNLSQQLRGQLVQLFAAYGARVEIVYLEVPPQIQQHRNRSRLAQVPQKVIDRMIDRLEIPNSTEAHQVHWIDNHLARSLSL
jgi:predicted kinase